MSRPAPREIAARLDALRQAMAGRQLAAYVVPTSDPHQSEYVPAVWRRREWISGFTGSAGTAVVTREGAWLWTDARYWLQAAQQLPADAFELQRDGARDVPKPAQWLASRLRAGDAVGVDPACVSIAQWRAWTEALAPSGVRLEPVAENLVDAIWRERPSLPAEPVMALDVAFAGRPWEDKVAELRDELRRARCDAHVVAALDSVAWLLNIRGRDVECNPLVVSYAIVTPERLLLFVDEAKLPAAVRRHLGGVEIHPYGAFFAVLAELAQKERRFWVDPAHTSQAVLERLLASGAEVHEAPSPILLAKAVKNETEIAGMRACHVRDGAAVCRFLVWLEEAMAAHAEVDEVSAAERLYAYRAEGAHFQGLSFATISAYGRNGAIVHYGPERGTCAKLEPAGLYLLDSGAQYLDGTTDITRTVAVGPVSREQQEAFTRVLKGHIAVATARFPDGTTGAQLDAFARRPLWESGIDYAHRTGHGVGHFLCVHEGPIGIGTGSNTPLKPRMVLSNEPGYYRAGAFGIRLENLVEVVELSPGEEGVPFYGFASLTLCPIDLRCVLPDLLDEGERAWLDAYHRTVRTELEPLLRDPRERRWLERATRPV